MIMKKTEVSFAIDGISISHRITINARIERSELFPRGNLLPSDSILPGEGGTIVRESVSVNFGGSQYEKV